MYFKDKLDSINAMNPYKCIHNFWQYCQNSCNIARILVILICMRNPVLPQIAAILSETVAAICQKAYIWIRVVQKKNIT